MPAECGEVPLQHEAARARLVDDVQAMPGAHQPAQRLGHRVDAAGDRAEVAHLDIPGFVGHGDVDAVLGASKPTYRVLDFRMVRLLANSQRPDRPPVRCIGVARHAFGVQPTVLQGTDRLFRRSHLV